MDWNGLDWNGLDWIAMGWNGMQWIGLYCNGLLEDKSRILVSPQKVPLPKLGVLAKILIPGFTQRHSPPITCSVLLGCLTNKVSSTTLWGVLCYLGTIVGEISIESGFLSETNKI